MSPERIRSVPFVLLCRRSCEGRGASPERGIVAGAGAANIRARVLGLIGPHAAGAGWGDGYAVERRPGVLVLVLSGVGW